MIVVIHSRYYQFCFAEFFQKYLYLHFSFTLILVLVLYISIVVVVVVFPFVPKRSSPLVIYIVFKLTAVLFHQNQKHIFQTKEKDETCYFRDVFSRL